MRREAYVITSVGGRMAIFEVPKVGQGVGRGRQVHQQADDGERKQRSAHGSLREIKRG
jgi:hypothetical protein